MSRDKQKEEMIKISFYSSIIVLGFNLKQTQQHFAKQILEIITLIFLRKQQLFKDLF